MKILDEPIEKSRLLNAEELYEGPMVKGVVDVQKRLIAVDGDMYADLERMLLATGSNQTDLWGVNFYPEEDDMVDFLEFDSMINIRPRQGNRSRSVDDPDIQAKIIEIVKQWIQ